MEKGLEPAVNIEKIIKICGSIPSSNAPTETVFKEKHGVLYGTLDAGVDFNSLYFIVNSVVSYPPPLQRERGEWERSLLLVEHICICLLIFKTTKGKRENTAKGTEGVSADLKGTQA